MPHRIFLGMKQKLRKLSDLPLWRLLVALDDAERIAGPDSSTARLLARLVQERLRAKDSGDKADEMGVKQ